MQVRGALCWTREHIHKTNTVKIWWESCAAFQHLPATAAAPILWSEISQINESLDDSRKLPSATKVIFIIITLNNV